MNNYHCIALFYMFHAPQLQLQSFDHKTTYLNILQRHYSKIYKRYVYASSLLYCYSITSYLNFIKKIYIILKVQLFHFKQIYFYCVYFVTIISYVTMHEGIALWDAFQCLFLCLANIKLTLSLEACRPHFCVWLTFHSFQYLLLLFLWKIQSILNHWQ